MKINYKLIQCLENVKCFSAKPMKAEMQTKESEKSGKPTSLPVYEI